ncbi:MAG: MerR family transcriptional regulator [Kibdelosporangium sp.]
MGTLYSIGELARRTGLTVKAIRFYADRGIVPPTDRSPAGYRLYGPDAVVRLELVRTLRELGLDLATIRRVLESDADLSHVAAIHAEALAVQIRILRLRHSVLTAIARRGVQETDLLMTMLSSAERDRLIAEFLDSVFGDRLPPGISRTMTPELPEDPSPEQVQAWIELAGLLRDPDFRDSVRRMAEHQARRDFSPLASADVLDIDPASAAADQIVQAATADCSADELLEWLRTANDPRRDVYLERLAIVNGWAAPVSPAPVFDWFIEALLVRSLN